MDFTHQDPIMVIVSSSPRVKLNPCCSEPLYMPNTYDVPVPCARRIFKIEK